MNQQNQGSSSSGKRKRGRPRKEETAVQGERLPIVPDRLPVMPGPDNVMSSNQTGGLTDDCDDEMVGKVVSGVIEGTFNDGYLLHVKIAETDTHLRGLVFLPGRVAPITPENDVAPHVRMIRRKEMPIPVPHPQTQMHTSVPPSGQSSKTPVEPESQVPTLKDQVLPTELHSGIPVSLDNQSGSGMVPMTHLPKIDTAISTQGIPQGISISLGNQPGPASVPAANLPTVDTATSTGGIPQGISFSLYNQSGSAIVPTANLSNTETVNFTEGIPHGISDPEHKSQSVSEMEYGNTGMQDPSMHEVDATRQVKEPFTDGGATKHLEATSGPINLEHIDKEHTFEEKAQTSVHKLNELIQDETKNINIDITHTPVSVVPESLPSEQVTKRVDSSEEKQPSPKSVDSSEEKQASPKSNTQDTKTKHTTETSSENLTFDTNGRSSTNVANAFDLESDPAPEAAPSESKFESKTSDSPQMRDPQNLPSSSAVTDEKDTVQPTDTPVGTETPFDQKSGN